MANYISYANQGATRNKPMSAQLVDAFGFLPEMGLGMEVFSGGQSAKGSGGARIGSVRHDHGGAGDVFFTRDGQRLNWQNEQDIPVFQEIVRRAKSAGVTGFGAGPGYMQPGSMHVGFGNPAVWGAGGKGANAPAWLREAYGQAPQQSAAGISPAVSTQGAAPVARAPTPSAGLLPMPTAPEEKALLGGLLTPDRRDHLIAALEGMTLNPNVAMMNAARDRTKGRAQARQQYEQERAGVEKTNKTIEWLNAQGRGDLAQAVAGGAIPASAAVQSAMQQPAPVKGTEIAGRLVNPMTGEVIADFSTPDDERYSQVVGQDLIDNYGASPDAVDPGALYNVGPDGKIGRIGGSGQTINVGGDGVKPIGTTGQAIVKDETAPNGYRVVNLPGSQAEKAEVAGRERAAVGQAQKDIRGTVVDDAVDQMVGMIDKDTGILDLPESGIVGNALAQMGVNQEAVDFKNTLRTVQAAVSFDTLQKMREASKTGGALGAVSEKELELLMAALGALDQSTSGPALKRNLLEIKRIMGKIENDPIAGAMYRGESPSAGGFGVTGVID